MIVGGWISAAFGFIMSILGMLLYNESLYRSEENFSTFTIILGIILLIAGIAMLLLGYNQKNKDYNYVQKIRGKSYDVNDFYQSKCICLKCGAIMPSQGTAFCTKCGNPLEKKEDMQ